MAALTYDMKRLVEQQRLGFCATVCADGSPNLSPKGTTCVWDDDHLCFAAIHSPQTVANIKRGSLVELNVVDPFVRKGYRFKGPAVVYDGGQPGYYAGIELLRHNGVASVDRINEVVVVKVDRARPLISPVYDDGAHAESDVVRIWQERYSHLYGVLSNTP